MDDYLRPVFWVGSTKKDLQALPDEVQDIVGYALHLAQSGKKHIDAKPLRGFSGAGVLEVRVEHSGDTFRAVYIIDLGTALYVLHCFKKKSKRGIQTPKRDIDLISQRLRIAQRHAEDSQHEKH